MKTEKGIYFFDLGPRRRLERGTEEEKKGEESEKGDAESGAIDREEKREFSLFLGASSGG